jgi:hypothetical protein
MTPKRKTEDRRKKEEDKEDEEEDGPPRLCRLYPAAGSATVLV